MFLAHNTSDIGDVLLCGHEVGEVVVFQRIVAIGDDCVSIPLDGHNVVGIVGTANVFQWLVENLTVVVELDAQHHERASMNVPALSHPRHLQSADDLTCCEFFRINQVVNA